MHGRKRQGLVLQPRDERLLRELGVMRFIDREQAKAVAGFRSTTRANARLLALVNADLLRRFFQGTIAGGRKALYALSAKGARLVGVAYRSFRHQNNELLVTNFFVAHQMAVNEVYVLAKFGPSSHESKVTRWLSFDETLAKGISLIPDGYFESAAPEGVVSCFLEVDLGTEGAAVWKTKTRNYLQYAISSVFRTQFGQAQFRVLVVANSDGRLRAIRKVVRAFTDKIFWFSTLDAIRAGMNQPVWLRSPDDTARALF